MNENVVLFPVSDEAIQRLQDNELTRKVRDLGLSAYAQQFNWEPFDRIQVAMDRIFKDACEAQDRSEKLLNEFSKPRNS